MTALGHDARIGPHTVNVDTDGQLGTVTVPDRAALGGQADVARVLLLRPRAQPISTHKLEVVGAVHHQQGTHKEEYGKAGYPGAHPAPPPGTEVSHWALPEVRRVCLSTAMMRGESATSMLRWPRATISTRSA